MSEKKRILSVDDSATIRFMIEKELKGDFDMVLAKSGEEALDILNEDQDFDIILMDVEMGALSGLEVCKKIKENKSSKNIPVIFLTSKADPEDIKAGFDACGSDYIRKPFGPIELRARIQNQVDIMAAREAIIKAERANTTQAMIVSLNYEIKNPLTIIKGNLDLLKRGMTDHQDRLQIMDESIERILEILEEINKLSDVDFASYASGESKMVKLK